MIIKSEADTFIKGTRKGSDDTSINIADKPVVGLPWIEKYRPRKLNDMTQDSTLIEFFNNCVKVGSMSHILLYGPPGTGKTSAALALGRELFKEQFSNRVIEFNASDDRGIGAVRDKITREAKKYVNECVSTDGVSIIPPFKIIILDEADSMTDEAQDALRVIIEKYSSVTRFCFICNYVSKITDAIKSRCSSLHFKKLSNECMKQKLKKIAEAELMNLSDNILNTIIDVSNGDMRKSITVLQNIRYKYNFKKLLLKPTSDLNIKELLFLSKTVIKPIADTKNYVVEADVYEIAATINNARAAKMVDEILDAKNIVELSLYSKKIISLGYPTDSIITQLNNAILKTPKLTDIEKAIILMYSSKIILKMKESANEYIQLLDYMSSVYGVKNKIRSYILIN